MSNIKSSRDLDIEMINSTSHNVRQNKKAMRNFLPEIEIEFILTMLKCSKIDKTVNQDAMAALEEVFTHLANGGMIYDGTWDKELKKIKTALQRAPESVDLESLKKDTHVFDGNQYIPRDLKNFYQGWNDCIEHLIKHHKGKVIA